MAAPDNSNLNLERPNPNPIPPPPQPIVKPEIITYLTIKREGKIEQIQIKQAPVISKELYETFLKYCNPRITVPEEWDPKTNPIKNWQESIKTLGTLQSELKKIKEESSKDKKRSLLWVIFAVVLVASSIFAIIAGIESHPILGFLVSLPFAMTYIGISVRVTYKTGKKVTSDGREPTENPLVWLFAGPFVGTYRTFTRISKLEPSMQELEKKARRHLPLVKKIFNEHYAHVAKKLKDNKLLLRTLKDHEDIDVQIQTLENANKYYSELPDELCEGEAPKKDDAAKPADPAPGAVATPPPAPAAKPPDPAPGAAAAPPAPAPVPAQPPPAASPADHSSAVVLTLQPVPAQTLPPAIPPKSAVEGMD